MEQFDRQDVVCLYLEAHAGAAEATPAPPAVTAVGIGDALDLGNTPAERVRLLDDLAALDDEGLVRTSERPVEGFREPRLVYGLTDAGHEHAARVRQRVRSTTVRVTNGTTEEVPLSAADEFLEAEVAPLARALARLDDDRRLRLERHVDAGFVDREAALSSVLDAVEGSFTRESRTVVLEGAAGMGKTALVERVREDLTDDHDDVVYARGAVPAGTSDPYAAFRRAFDVVPDGGTLLERLSEAHSSVAPDTPRELRAQRARLFEDLADHLRAAAREQPVLVVVENLQWAETATLELFAHLATSVDEWVHPVAFVGTYRTPALAGDDHPLGPVLERVRRAGNCETVSLEPLERGDTRALLAGIVGSRDLPSEFVDAVHEQTGGNPLFVRETATHLLESGAVDPVTADYPRSTDALSLPREVAEQVDRRVDQLDERGRELLRVGAVLGERVPTQVLAEATDLDPATRREYVDLLVASRIWTSASGGTGGPAEATGEGGPVGSGAVAGDLQFVSGALREAVIDRLPEEVHGAYHERVAEALSTVYLEESDEAAARIAHHYDEAGDVATAVEYYRRAGDHARAAYAHEEAIDHYRTALSLGESADGVTDGECFDVAYDLRGAMEVTGDFEGALDVVEAWLDRVEPGSEEACKLLARRTEIERKQGDLDASLETARRLLEVAEGLADQELEGTAHNLVGEAHLFRNEYDAATDHLERALDRLRAAGADDRTAFVHINLGNIAFRRGDHGEARRQYEQARERLDPAAHAGKLALVEMNLGNIPSQQGRYGDARERYAAALESFEAIGDRHRTAMTRANLGLAASNQGAYGAARDHLEAALSGLEAAGDTQRLALVRMFLGRVARNSGDLAAAADHLETAREHVRSAGSRRRAAEVELEVGRLALARGDHGEAREQATAALEDLSAVDDELGVAKARLVAGRAHLAGGDVGAAAEAAEAARGPFDRLDATHWFARSQRLVGRVAAEGGDPGRAREQLRTALDTLEAVEAPRDELATLRELVEQCRRQDDEAAATKWCRRAREALADAPPGTAEQHRDWVDRQASALGLE